MAIGFEFRPIAGRYVGTYDGIDVGITDQGFELQHEGRWEVINASDAYGDSIIDGVYRGGDAYLQFLAKSFAQDLFGVGAVDTVSPFWPWNPWGVMQVTDTNPDPSTNVAAPIGRMAQDVALDMNLTVTAGTPADDAVQAGSIGPAILDAAQSILAANYPQSLLFHSKLRQVPIRLSLLPYETSVPPTITITQWFTTA